MAKKDWDLAAYTDEFGLLGKSIGSGFLRVPGHIQLTAAQDALEWEWKWEVGGANNLNKVIDPAPDLLHEFVRLHELTPAAVLKFSRKWGVLHLGARNTPCQQSSSKKLEPLEDWYYWSRRAASVLNIGASLNKKQVGKLEDWEALRGTNARCPDLRAALSGGALTLLICLGKEYPYDANGFGTPGFKRKVENERSMLMGEIYLWLRMGKVGFVAVPGEHGWSLKIDFIGGFLAAVALQLALTLSNVDALFTCSHCGVPYVREGKLPKPGSMNFCQRATCGNKAALQHADRRRRAKMTEVKRMHADGKPARAIAAETGSDLETIKGWIRKWGANGKKTGK